MPWKPKEKDLSEEEAISLAKKELAPYWHGSPPLFVGLPNDQQQVNLYPLQATFNTENWAILLVDPMTFNGESFLQQFAELQVRYSSLGIQFLAILVSSYEFLKESQALERILQRIDPSYICALDFDGMIQTALNIKNAPGLLLLTEGKVHAHFQGEHSISPFETSIQGFIRSKEQGLPLLPLFRPFTRPLHDTGSFEFPKDLGRSDIRLEGNWKIEKNWIETEDSDARILFKAQDTFVSLVVGPAKPLMLTENCRTAIEINEAPVLDVFSGSHIESDEEGRTVIRSQSANFYNILKDLTEDQKNITLFFPVAKRIAIRLYAIKFANFLNSQMPEAHSAETPLA